MKTQWTFKNNEIDKPRVESYWAKKQPRIERLLSNYHDDLRELRLALYRHHGEQGPWELRAVLQLPTGTLVTEETGPDWRECIDVVADELVRQIKRHKEQVRKDYLYRRRRVRREDQSTAGPYLERDRTENRSEAFFQLLQPLLPQVYAYARRELQLMELEGRISRGRTTAQDVIDEMLTRAWDRYSGRPRKIELETWLIGLVRERLAELADSPETVSFSETVEGVKEEPMTPEGDLDETDYWLERIFQQTEPVTIEDLIPDFEADEAWYQLSREEQQQRMQQALCQLPRDQREALLLYAVDGLEEAEISHLQNKDVSDVQCAIEEAKTALTRQLMVQPA